MPVTRRLCLKRFGSLLGATSAANLATGAQVSSSAESSKLAMPGPYRGKVVAVAHPGCITGGTYQAEPVRQMMRRGMAELRAAIGSKPGSCSCNLATWWASK